MCLFQALLWFLGPSTTRMANPLSREVRVYINMVQSKSLLNVPEKTRAWRIHISVVDKGRKSFLKTCFSTFSHLMSYLYLVGTQQFWLRASKREFEMQTQKPEWRLASKIHTLTQASSKLKIYDRSKCCWITRSHSFLSESLDSSLLSVSFFPAVTFRTYWGLRNHFPGEADALYNSLESSYQRTLQSCLKSSGSVASLPQSDRSSSSSQESLK